MILKVMNVRNSADSDGEDNHFGNEVSDHNDVTFKNARTGRPDQAELCFFSNKISDDETGDWYSLVVESFAKLGGRVDANHQARHEQELFRIDSETKSLPAVLLPGRGGGLNVSDLIHAELANASHPLKNVRCAHDDQIVSLSGVVTRYHFVQIAIETARRLASGRQIDCQIRIISPVS